MSDTKTQTATATETAFDLTPPDPVPEVKPEKAAGLVPVSDEVKSKLETKVDGFVADLIAEDANSPEFGKKVDQLTNMGRKEIMAAAGMFAVSGETRPCSPAIDAVFTIEPPPRSASSAEPCFRP